MQDDIKQPLVRVSQGKRNWAVLLTTQFYIQPETGQSLNAFWCEFMRFICQHSVLLFEKFIGLHNYFIAATVYTKVSWKVLRLTKILSRNVAKWHLCFNIVLLAVYTLLLLPLQCVWGSAEKFIGWPRYSHWFCNIFLLVAHTPLQLDSIRQKCYQPRISSSQPTHFSAYHRVYIRKYHHFSLQIFQPTIEYICIYRPITQDFTKGQFLNGV